MRWTTSCKKRTINKVPKSTNQNLNKNTSKQTIEKAVLTRTDTTQNKTSLEDGKTVKI